MIKKVLLFALVMFPVLSFSQETRIAYIDYYDVAVSMPEYKLMQDSLQKAQEGFIAEMKALQEDYSKKQQDFVANQETFSEAIKVRRLQEIQSIQTSAENFEQHAGQQMEEMQQRMLTPLHTRLQKAVEEVLSENNFLYILDSGAIRAISPNAVNATTLVKKKLGVQ